MAKRLQRNRLLRHCPLTWRLRHTASGDETYVYDHLTGAALQQVRTIGQLANVHELHLESHRSCLWRHEWATPTLLRSLQRLTLVDTHPHASRHS